MYTYTIRCSCGNKWVVNGYNKYTKCFNCGKFIKLKTSYITLPATKRSSFLSNGYLWAIFIIGLFLLSLEPMLSAILITICIFVFIFKGKNND